MSEAEVRSQLNTLRNLLVRDCDVEKMSAAELAKEVRLLRNLVGNAMALAELIRIQLALTQSELAAARGELQ